MVYFTLFSNIQAPITIYFVKRSLNHTSVQHVQKVASFSIIIDTAEDTQPCGIISFSDINAGAVVLRDLFTLRKNDSE